MIKPEFIKENVEIRACSLCRSPQSTLPLKTPRHTKSFLPSSFWICPKSWNHLYDRAQKHKKNVRNSLRRVDEQSLFKLKCSEKYQEQAEKLFFKSALHTNLAFFEGNVKIFYFNDDSRKDREWIERNNMCWFQIKLNDIKRHDWLLDEKCSDDGCWLLGGWETLFHRVIFDNTSTSIGSL